MPPRPVPSGHLVRATIVALGLVPGAVSSAIAQGRTAAPLLAMPASARAAAMGDAYGAPRPSAFDAASLFHNPAHLAVLSGTAATLSVERYLASSTAGAVAFATRAGRLSVGAGAVALGYPDVAEIVPDAGGVTGTETGAQVSAHDIVAAVAIAGGGARARVGALLEYASQSIAGTSGGAAAAGVGGGARVAAGRWGRLDATAALQHVGGRLENGSTSAPLPRAWRVGASLADHRLARGTWEATAELVQVRDLTASAHAGVEGEWTAGAYALAARAGWVSQPAGAVAEPLTLGAGLRRDRLWIDYAWRRFGAMGSTHRVGVRWQR